LVSQVVGHVHLQSIARSASRRSAAAREARSTPGSCAAGCETGFACLDGLCVPGANVAGGLGSSCTNNEECITGTCAIAGEESHCTGACNAADASCPDGFDCLESNICWPESSGGGCSTDGNSAGFLIIGLGFGLVLLRRGRRS
jgi:hypothetical protein